LLPRVPTRCFFVFVSLTPNARSPPFPPSFLPAEKQHRDDVNCIAITPDGSKLVSGADDYALNVWDTDSLQCVGKLLGMQAFVRYVTISPNGTLVAGGQSGKVGYYGRLENSSALIKSAKKR
jgi:WD40 repeat protein